MRTLKKNRFTDLMKKYNVTEFDISIRYGIKLRTVRSWKWGEREIPQHIHDLLENELRRMNNNDEKNLQAGM